MSNNSVPSAEIISIGDELTSGLRLDTNSQWLSQQLNKLGIAVKMHSTVADDLMALHQLFVDASRRSRIIISNGGMGPTADDLTRQAIAKAASVEMGFSEKTLHHIQSLFAAES